MRPASSIGSLALVPMLALAACSSPSEPSDDDLLARLTADGSASFALAALDDPQHLASQRGPVIVREDLACSAEGTSLRSWTTDTLVLHGDGRAERIHQNAYANAAGGVAHVSRGVSQGTWEPFSPTGWFHYSSGPSIRLVMTMAPSVTPVEVYFRVHSRTELSTHTQIAGVHHCPNSPTPGHSVMHQGILRYRRF